MSAYGGFPNGIRWDRYRGFGWWTQDLRVARRNGRRGEWPIRPHIRVWASRNRRTAILLPFRSTEK